MEIKSYQSVIFKQNQTNESLSHLAFLIQLIQHPLAQALHHTLPHIQPSSQVDNAGHMAILWQQWGQAAKGAWLGSEKMQAKNEVGYTGAVVYCAAGAAVQEQS